MNEEATKRLERLKLGIEKIVEKANDDGVITEEEYKIINVAKNGLSKYMDLLSEAMEDGVIDQSEMDALIALQEEIMSDSYFVAMEDNQLDFDEMILLKTLLMSIDPKASVSWLDEDAKS